MAFLLRMLILIFSVWPCRAGRGHQHAIVMPAIHQEGILFLFLDKETKQVMQTIVPGEAKGCAAVIQRGKGFSSVYLLDNLVDAKSIAVGDRVANIFVRLDCYRDLIGIAWARDLLPKKPYDLLKDGVRQVNFHSQHINRIQTGRESRLIRDRVVLRQSLGLIGTASLLKIVTTSEMDTKTREQITELAQVLKNEVFLFLRNCVSTMKKMDYFSWLLEKDFEWIT